MGQAYENLCDLEDEEQSNTSLKRRVTILKKRVASLEEVIKPFAAMSRADCADPDDQCVLTRGHCEDLTMICEGDFRKAQTVLQPRKKVKKQYGLPVQ